MDLKTLLSQSKDHLDFWDLLEQNGGRLLFEEYVALYLKATLPGDTYWLGEDVVPAHIAQKYRFTNLLKGKRSMGGDVINIYQNRAVAYESKWFDDKESINFKLVANKQKVIDKTGIDQLIFTTNARRTSDAVTEWIDEAAFMFQEEWVTKEVYDTVKTYIKGQVKKTYKPMTPRDKFFRDALDELKTDFDKKFAKATTSKILTRIFQHWPAASGKGSFPRLAYDMIFESAWDYKKGYPINLVVNPTLTVLKGNLVKQIEHDLALGNDSVHVIYAGDVTKAAKDTEELQTIRSLAKVFTKKLEFVKFLKQTNNQTVWIHTTVHSYDRLATVVKGQKKSFYFGHIDEVHHMIQPDYSSWTAPLNDSACKIQIRLMSSANKRKARGTGASYSMDDPAFCDIQVKELDEQTAVALGYKRRTVMLNYVYDDHSFPTEWIERLEQGNQPLVKLKGTDVVVPMNWFMAVDSLLRFRIEHSERNHTKLTLNTIKECDDFAKFLDAIRPKLLKELAHSNNPVYRRLLKAKILVADTANNSTVKLLKEVSAIPDTYKDSFIIHCKLLGEGWDPENGWIDSNMFVSPTYSEIRIYQDVNRGSRIGDGTKSINYIVQAFLKEEHNHFNEMFSRIKFVGTALEVGVEDITEQVIFKQVKSIPKGKKMPRRVGNDILTYYDEIGADFFAHSFSTYIKEGRYHKFGGLVNDLLIDYISIDKEKKAYLREPWGSNEVNQILIKKYKDFFAGKTKARIKDTIGSIKFGEHRLLSDENANRAITWRIEREELKKLVSSNAQKDFEESIKKYATLSDNQISEVRKSIANKYAGISDATVRSLNIKNIKGLVQIQKQHQQKIVSIYKNNYKKYNSLLDLDNAIPTIALETYGFITVKQFCIEKIRKQKLKFIGEYFSKTSSQRMVKTKMKNGTVKLGGRKKSFTTPEGVFDSMEDVAKHYGIDRTSVRHLRSLRNDLYYNTNKGPGKAKRPKINGGVFRGALAKFLNI